MKKEFTKYHSLALKGIAIIMMFFHHGFRDVKLFKNYNISFFPLNQNFVIDISSFFKICVSIFVFITGYGLIKSLRKLNKEYEFDKKDITKWVVERSIKLLLGFMVIALILYIGLEITSNAVKKEFFNKGIFYGIIQIVIDFFGLAKLFGTETLDGNWWYMSLAILLILTIPIISKLFKKYGYAKVILAYVIIPRILHLTYVNSSYISFLLPAMLGIICAENDLLVKWANFAKEKKLLKFIIEVIGLIILVKVFLQLPTSKFYEIKYGIIPVGVVFFLYEFIIDIPIIKNILEFCGKYSMNMFLIHGSIRIYCIKFFTNISNNFLVVALGWFIVTLILAIFVEYIKKLIKLDKLSEKIFTKFDKKYII